MNRRAFRKQWLRLKDKYERRGAKIMRKYLREAALSIDFDNISEFSYRADVQFAISEVLVKRAYRNVYADIGLAHGRKIGQQINKEIKMFGFDSFRTSFLSFLQQWLLAEGGQRILSVRQSLSDYIIQYIAQSMEQGKDIRTIARELQKLIRSRGFYRWQIERIVRTETTAAANYGASFAGEDSGLVLEKIWISSNDARTRQREKGDQYDHLDMDGIKIDQEGRFNVQGDFLRFPGDPEGHPANTINCRCTVVLRGKRDANGDLIFRNRVNPNPGVLV